MKYVIAKYSVLVVLLVVVGCLSVTEESGESGEQKVVEQEVVESEWEPVRVVEGESLDDEELQALLERLPELEQKEDDEVEFRRREESMPPPLTGDDIEGDWPPDLSSAAAQTAPDGPLKAQAFRPTGEVSPPFQVAVAFDRPVVAVGAVGTQEIPQLSMSPDIEGRWRWLGTQTVVFEPADRWPMATEFEIEIAEGLESVDGAKLEEALRFSFATPAPEVDTVVPNNERTYYRGSSHSLVRGPQAIDSPVVVVFNQAIDAQSAQAISVAGTSGDIPMDVVEGDGAKEIASDRGLEKAHEQRRTIVLRPTRDYSSGEEISVVVDGPLKSAEGPVLGSGAHRSGFDVRGAFEVDSVQCGHFDECRPTNSIIVHFSNSIDEDATTTSDIELDPAVDHLDVAIHGNRLSIFGSFEPRTSYELQVSEELTDIFGQPLRGDRRATIDFGSYRPVMAGPDRSMLVRPTDALPRIPIMVTELETLRVRIFDVGLQDWDAERREELLESDDAVEQSTLQFDEAQRHRPTVQWIDLSAVFDDDEPGQALVVIDEPSPWPHNRGQTWSYWVQRTDLAVDLSTDDRQMETVVTQISDGQPAGDVQIATGNHVLATTDDSGEAGFSVPASSQPMTLSRGDDVLIIPVQGSSYRYARNMSWNRVNSRSRALWYVVDDRQMYRPGESVTIRGWLRMLENTPRSQPRGVRKGTTLNYQVFEPRRNEIADGEIELDGFGGFEFEFEIPEGANLGRASIVLNPDIADARQHRHTISIQEFRRPEYEVGLETDEGPHSAADETSWTAEANYYAGGAVSGASTTWRFSESTASFSPSGWSDWSFGAWSPWWSPWSRAGDSSETQVLPEEFRGSIEGQTDAAGRDNLSMTFEAPTRGLPRRVEATVSVQDMDRQAWEAKDSVLVHPSSLYVGLRSETNFIQRDETYEVEAVAVDVDGEVVEDRELKFSLNRRGGSDLEEVETCDRTSGEEPVRCSFSDLNPGSYRVIANVADDRDRSSESELNFWVAGRDTRGAETAEEDELMLIPETDAFEVGDRAQLFVQAPYYPLDAVVELRRDGRYDRRRVTITEQDSTIDIDIEESMISNIHVNVTALGADDGYEPDHFASGSIELQVDRGPRTLGVEIEPESTELSPGQEAGFEARVTDADGQAVEGAQVLLFAVDESVLSLSDYLLGDPVSVFYPTRSASVSDIRSRAWLLLAGDDEFESDDSSTQDLERMENARGDAVIGRSAPMAMEADASAAPTDGDQAIELREVFDALAFFRSDLVTDSDGQISLTETMPDSLTRYRVMAVAVDGDTHFGHSETDVTVRKPLMVSPSAPRFLNVGDKVDLPVVIHNRSDRDQSVDVGLRATGGLKWLEGPGRTVEVPAEDRVEVRFAAEALSAGDTRIQVAVSAGELSDAELVKFPILTPATTEAFATYGTIDDGDDDAVLQALKVPTDAYRQYGGLDISTSSTQLQALTDAFLYLTTYRFNFSEPLASRILSVLALYDVLDAFDAPELPQPAQLQESLQEWTQQLLENQRRDGGFGFWERSRESSPFVSVHATLALTEAQDAGIEVDSRSLQRANRYLENIDNHTSSNFSQRARATVAAYALHVLQRQGQAQQRALDGLVGRYGIEILSLEALGWLLPMAEGTQFEERFLQRITNQVQETAATAEFQDSYSADAHQILHTTRRTDGVVLDGLMAVDEAHPLIDKVVRGLLGHRQRGRWSNTQENVFILMALKRYFDTYESVEPDFIARAWLGDDQIGEHEFRGRSTDRHSVEVPMSFLHDGPSTQPVVFERDGQGRMYYRMGVRYAPKSRILPPHTEGFTVERTYEAVDNPDDVQRTDDGWEVKAGARVRVELSMTIPARRYHVALVDWLPAGFEPINPALAISSVEDDLVGGSRDRPRWGWWGRPWFEHQNMRDERVEAFSSLVHNGVHTYSYVARATTPGQFVAMPAKAEEMYHPETFGRSSTEIVRVVDR